MSKLFKKFGFLKSSQELNAKGVGLGLYISKKLVNIFEGNVGVKSEFKKGSEFSFSFKLSQEEQNQRSLARIINQRVVHYSKCIVTKNTKSRCIDEDLESFRVLENSINLHSTYDK